MEKTHPPLPQKSSSFSSSRGERLREINRNLSLGNIRLEDIPENKTGDDGSRDQEKKPADTINEEEVKDGGVEGEEKESGSNDNEDQAADPQETPDDLATILEDIDRFLGVLLSVGERNEQDENPDGALPDIPEPTIEKFTMLVEEEIALYESGNEKWSPEHYDDAPSLRDAIDRLAKLTAALTPLAADPKYFDAMNLTGAILHHAMCFSEDELFSLLEESSKTSKQDPVSSGGKQDSSKTKRPPSFSRSMHDHDRCALPSTPPTEANTADSYPSPETVAKLRLIAGGMIMAGYDTECCQVFAIARRNALESSLSEVGFDKIAIDDVQRMAWDSLEGEIANWIKTFRHAITVALPQERDLCDSVFARQPSIAGTIYRNLARSTILQLLNFAEAVGMTKRSSEKLFRVLDMYEALREMIPKIDQLLFCCEVSGEEEERNEEESCSSSACSKHLKSEMSAVQSRLGESAVAIFCDLESSIKSDNGKTPVPGGAVHPLTRYVMNYIKYACEYVNTLEQIFRDHNKSEDDSSSSYHDDDSSHDSSNRHNSSSSYNNNSHDNRNASSQTPFANQLIEMMELLQSNLDSKAKLYKDVALSNIFLMNNGRYIVQKIKGSAEINKLLGDTWSRKISSDLRQYHKTYKMDTWSKVLACFKDDGLTVKGSVSKPVLKERFKNFNALFEEIHKVQSTWVVSDEQLQSELRVSISAVVVPAYRSFLGRFQQYLDPGRQTEKYIKFGPDDLENYIDELFDGNPTSMARRRP